MLKSKIPHSTAEPLYSRFFVQRFRLTEELFGRPCVLRYVPLD